MLVGENSSGKSTIVEAVAMAFGARGRLDRSQCTPRHLYCLDEPEAALSFSAQMALVGTMHDRAEPMRYLRHVL